MLSIKQGRIKYHFWVFSMNRPGIEPWSPQPLTNNLLIRPILKKKLKRFLLEQDFCHFRRNFHNKIIPNNIHLYG